MTLKIEHHCLSIGEEEKYDAFVQKCAAGTFFHTTLWKRILENSFPVKSMYLVFDDEEDNIVGACPFVIRKQFWPFVAFHSLPDSEFGGPIGQPGYKVKIASCLLPSLRRLARLRRAIYCVIRLTDEETYRILAPHAVMINRSFGLMELDLKEKPPDFIWDNIFRKAEYQRKYIGRFVKSGFQTREARDIDDIKKFYSLYCEDMSFIGAPFYPFHFFENIHRIAFPQNFKVLLAERNENCVGALGFFTYKDTIYLAYLGLNRDVPPHYHTSYYMYWSAIEWAHRNGIRYVNFGGTPSGKNSQYFRLKAKFGTVFRQRYLLYIPLESELASRFLVKTIETFKNVLPKSSRQTIKTLIPK